MKLLRLSQVERELGLTRFYVEKAIAIGELDTVELLGSKRVTEESVERFKKSVQDQISSHSV